MDVSARGTSVFTLGEFLRYYDEKNRVQIERDSNATSTLKVPWISTIKFAALRNLSEYAALLVTNRDQQKCPSKFFAMFQFITL